MKTKIVYSLSSNEDDIYLDQLILSIYSLKSNVADAYVIVAVDPATNKSLSGNRSRIKELASEIVVIDTPIDLDKKARSRWVKTSVRQNIEGRFLFIDTDTIICRDLSCIDQYKTEVMAVLDKHLKLSQNQMYHSILNQMVRVGFTPDEADESYFNSGIMLVNDTPLAYSLYKKWHAMWYDSYKKGINIDQPALAMANKSLGYIIQEMSGEWNCQILGNGLKYCSNAFVFHYFNTNNRTRVKSYPFELTNNDFFYAFRESGYNIDASIKRVIDHPLSLFSTKVDILSNDALDAYYSDAFQMLNYLYGFHPRVFNIIDRVSKMIFRFFSRN